MSKVKTSFFCQNCGAQYSKWQGQCNSCKEWNTIVEEIIQKEEKSSWKPSNTESKRVSKPLRINEIDSTQEVRMDTTDGELNRVLGGGIVPGSLILLGGEPGIGKDFVVIVPVEVVRIIIIINFLPVNLLYYSTINCGPK